MKIDNRHHNANAGLNSSPALTLQQFSLIHTHHNPATMITIRPDRL